MTSEDTILSEIKHIRTDLSKVDSRMDKMEVTMSTLALQSEQIAAMGQRVNKLESWNTHQASELKEVAKFQGGCIRHSWNAVVEKQWAAIKILAGAMLTGFGLLGAFIRWGGVA